MSSCPSVQGGELSCLAAGMPGGDYGELAGSLPAIASLNASYSTSLSLPSPYLFVPPAERRVISDVRRTFCLFVTFDLLFISLLWIIELNVSVLVCSCVCVCFAQTLCFDSVVFTCRFPAPSGKVWKMRSSDTSSGLPSLTSL